MNVKQTIPAVAAIPPLLMLGALVALTVWILSDNDKRKPEQPTENDTVSHPILPIPPNSAGNSTENPDIRANYAGTSTVLMSADPSVKAATQIRHQSSPKMITIEIMAEVFKNGARKLSRKAAVTALNALGFGKSAAYEALSSDGRFSAWLQFAPDGLIAWKASA